MTFVASAQHGVFVFHGAKTQVRTKHGKFLTLHIRKSLDIFTVDNAQHECHGVNGVLRRLYAALLSAPLLDMTSRYNEARGRHDSG